jgi:hypothetical protein
MQTFMTDRQDENSCSLEYIDHEFKVTFSIKKYVEILTGSFKVGV